MRSCINPMPRACHQFKGLFILECRTGLPYLKAITTQYALPDDQPERIKDLLPGRQGHVGMAARGNQLFIEAVLIPLPRRHRLARPTGALWRLLFGASAPFALERMGHLAVRIRGASRRMQATNTPWLTRPFLEPASTARRLKRGLDKARESGAVVSRGRLKHEDPRHGRCTAQSGALSPHARAGS